LRWEKSNLEVVKTKEEKWMGAGESPPPNCPAAAGLLRQVVSEGFDQKIGEARECR